MATLAKVTNPLNNRIKRFFFKKVFFSLLYLIYDIGGLWDPCNKGTKLKVATLGIRWSLLKQVKANAT
jgi:hypothetical protein